MRIALLSWETAHSVHVGGVAVHVTELAYALERKGHEVHVFTRMGRDSQSTYEKIFGVHYHRCFHSFHPDFVEEMNNMCRSFVDAVFETENHIGAFDIIHAHDWLTANALSWIKKGRGRKTIFTMHSTEYGRCGNNHFHGNSEKIRNIEWEGMYVANQVIAVSNALKEELVDIYNTPADKVDVIYNGITVSDHGGWLDPASVKRLYNVGPLDPTVLFAGRMVYQKGPDILLEAIPQILKNYSNAKFIFVGDGDMRMGLERRAEHLGIGYATRFLGHLGGWRLKDIFKATDCVCVPSRNEPFGIVILEAWSAGKPVIASVNGGPSEIVWHDVNGFKIYDNPDSVAWGVNTLFSDFEYARWMGNNGKIACESSFSWDIIANEVLAVYAK